MQLIQPHNLSFACPLKKDGHASGLCVRIGVTEVFLALLFPVDLGQKSVERRYDLSPLADRRSDTFD